MKKKALFIAALIVVIFVVAGFASNWFRGGEPAASPRPAPVLQEAAPTEAPATE